MVGFSFSAIRNFSVACMEPSNLSIPFQLTHSPYEGPACEVNKRHSLYFALAMLTCMVSIAGGSLHAIIVENPFGCSTRLASPSCSASSWSAPSVRSSAMRLVHSC